MRIISGCRRGHKLAELEGQNVRPTTDRVKESMFNLIRAYVPEARVLDMFAGSGALSLEALSGGAKYAWMVDIDRRSTAVIKRNVQELKFDDICTVIEKSCFDFVRATDLKFDIIFLDPPYNKGFIEPALAAIAENDILDIGGIAVLESDSTDFKSDFAGLEIIKQKRYGRTYVTVYQRID